MDSVEKYLNSFNIKGFNKIESKYKTKYILSPNLGEGGFTLLGDVNKVYACISDVTFYKQYVVLETVKEKILEFGQFYTGDVNIYKNKNDLIKLNHGLSIYVNYPYFFAYKKIEANKRLLNVGLCFRESFFEEIKSYLPNNFWDLASKYLIRDNLSFPHLNLITDQIKNCKLEDDNLNLFIKAKGLEAISFILDYLKNNVEKPLIKLTEYDKTQLSKVKNIIDNNYINPLSIKELANISALNQEKLIKGFKEINGVTIFNYIRRLRMKNAMDLLLTTDYPILKISKMVGYSGDGHFYKSFKDIYKTTPKVIRETIVKKQK